MFDFEDEFIIESYRIPWLIWVQLLVMILLVIVLVFGFGICALDLSGNPNCSSASSSSLSSSRSSGKNPLFNAITCSDSSKIEGNESDQRKMDPGTSKGIVEEESMERDESSAKEIALFRLFDIAKQAFLKCLGLGYSSSESSHKNKHGKRD